jgi:hypothetical protein
MQRRHTALQRIETASSGLKNGIKTASKRHEKSRP